MISKIREQILSMQTAFGIMHVQLADQGMRNRTKMEYFPFSRVFQFYHVN